MKNKYFKYWFGLIVFPMAIWFAIGALKTGDDVITLILTSLVLSALIAFIFSIFYKWYREGRPKKQLETDDQMEKIKKTKLVRLLYKVGKWISYLIMLYPVYFSIFALIGGVIGINENADEQVGFAIGFGFILIFYGAIALLIVNTVFPLIAKFRKIELHEVKFDTNNQSLMKRQVPIYVTIIVLTITIILTWLIYNGGV